MSDMDIVGFAIPPKNVVFPHLAGKIEGFGKPPELFGQWQQHHVIDKDADREYDFTIYSIVKFFDLAMANNPNIIETLYTPQRCVLFSSRIAQMVRDRRSSFIHKGCYGKFRGYALSQLHKIATKANSSNPKRQATIEAHGHDTKFSYHVVRLALQCEQILGEHDLTLDKNAEVLKSIRRGDWSEQRIREWFSVKELQLEELYGKSTLRQVPDEASIKSLLLECLEEHYGSLDDAIRVELPIESVLRDLENLVEKYK